MAAAGPDRWSGRSRLSPATGIRFTGDGNELTPNSRFRGNVLLRNRSRMKSMPELRKAGIEDAGEIARLAIELGYDVCDLEIRNRLVTLTDSERHLIAVAAAGQSKLVGWVSAEVRLILESGERADLVGLVVDPAARRRGIGRALVETAERWAREMGLPRIVVKMNIERAESHGFYEAMGYAREKMQHSYSKALTNTS